MRTTSVLLGALAVLGCDRGVTVARDIVLDTAATQVTFPAPVAAESGARVLCLEFALPGDSRTASALAIVLQGTDGVPDALRGVADRTGEATVCLRDTIARARTYTGAVIVAPRAITVRYIRWTSPVRDAQRPVPKPTGQGGQDERSALDSVVDRRRRRCLRLPSAHA